MRLAYALVAGFLAGVIAILIMLPLHRVVMPGVPLWVLRGPAFLVGGLAVWPVLRNINEEVPEDKRLRFSRWAGLIATCSVLFVVIDRLTG
ncbi:MAG TPA: hypothetical protein VND92_11505 [Vicinamibacterales bacterium]|nr:hypothetical protein [Vicinamibacterales bacterium]